MDRSKYTHPAWSYPRSAAFHVAAGRAGQPQLARYGNAACIDTRPGVLATLLFFGATNDVPYFQHEAIFEGTLLQRAQILGGLLMIAQGFETSRYLGHAYDAETRVRTMRNAQLLSSGIYVAFIGLSCPSRVLGNIVVLAPIFLLIAAIASQFSAAIADIAGFVLLLPILLFVIFASRSPV
ncbi:MAG: hypothetical protein GWP02_03475 [Desulfobulbaceae bacterium]|nr:hypothetical protein [Desulfobulbaceae bacterium]